MPPGFTQPGARCRRPRSWEGTSAQLPGRGTIELDTGGLDYQMSLALAPTLFANVTRPELSRPLQGPDGFAEVDFRLYGTTLDPQTDLVSRVAKAAAGHAMKEQLRLFG